jgi:multidrug efflux pump
MLGVTFFGLFLTPVFYITIRGITRRLRPAPRGVDPAVQPSGGSD